MANTNVVGMVASTAAFVNNRRLGDELVYCSTRTNAVKYLSSAIPVPSLLVHPSDIGEAQSTIKTAKSGSEFKKQTRHARSLMAAPSSSLFGAPSLGQHQYDRYAAKPIRPNAPNFDFSCAPSFVRCFFKLFRC